MLEALAVTLGRNARARALQLPAWNEALGLPRAWDQQWALRIQQILAFETDMLEYPDIFEGSVVMDGLVAELLEGARAEMAVVQEHGGAVQAVDYMKASLVESHRERIARIEAGEQTVVGINKYTETEPSPLTAAGDGGIMTVDHAVEQQAKDAIASWRKDRDQAAVDAALTRLAAVAKSDENIMPASIEAARAGVTTGEWAKTLRAAFGEYRGPTGVGEASATLESSDAVASVQAEVERVSDAIGRRIKILVGKPGLDGHSNGAEQIAVRARDVGMDVVYEGIRLTPEQITHSAVQEGVHVIGLSILSGSHLELIPAVIEELRAKGVDVPVIVGGIIPEADVAPLKAAGVAGVYTPKDFDISVIMGDIVRIVAAANGVLDEAGIPEPVERAAAKGPAAPPAVVRPAGSDRPRRYPTRWITRLAPAPLCSVARPSRSNSCTETTSPAVSATTASPLNRLVAAAGLSTRDGTGTPLASTRDETSRPAVSRTP